MKKAFSSLLAALLLLPLLCCPALAADETDSVNVLAFRPSEDGQIQVDGCADELYWLLDTPVGSSTLGAVCDGFGLYLAFETTADAAQFTINGITVTCVLGDAPTTSSGAIAGQNGVYELSLGYTALSLKPAQLPQISFAATIGSDSVSGTLELCTRALAPTGTGKDLTGADYCSALNTSSSDKTGNITVAQDGTFTFKNDSDGYYSCTTLTSSDWSSLSGTGLMLSFRADFNDLPTSSDTTKPMYNFGLFWFIRAGDVRQDMAFWSDEDGQIMFAAKQDSLDATRANAIPTGIYLDTPQAQGVRVRILLDKDSRITLYINGKEAGSLDPCPLPSTNAAKQFAFYVDHRKRTSTRSVDVTLTDFSVKELAAAEPRPLYSMGLALFTNDDDPTARKTSAYSVNRLVTFDTTHNSLVLDQGSSMRFNRIDLYDADEVSRVSQNDLSVYVSTTGDANSWTKVTGWQLHQSGSRYTLYNLDQTARYVKVHCHLDNLNDAGDPVSFSPSFTGYIAEMMEVSYSPYLLGADSEFAYTGNLTVHNPTQTELYDQVVQLSLAQIGAKSGQYQASCADFRFTLDDQLLAHWYDGAGTFHVRIPAVPAQGSVAITPHWGNAGAEDISDPQATMEAVYGKVSLIDLSAKTDLRASGRAFTFPDGSIIAVSRDRDTDGSAGTSDTSELAAVFSYDGGRTFTATATDLIPDDHSANTAGYGGYIWDPNGGTQGKGRLMLMAYKVYSAYDAAAPATADCRFVYLYTDDYGQTWSDPVVLCDANAAAGELNDGEAYLTIQNSQGRFYQLSYCDGLTLRDADGTGPNVDYVFTHSYVREDGTFAGAALYSTDGGASWTASSGDFAMDSATGHENGISETAFAQLDDGSLYILARAQASGNIYFYESWSYDYGNTWTTAQPSQVISTNTSPVFLPYGEDRLLMWAGNSTLGATGRRRFPLTLAISSDNYATYDRSINLTLGTAYDTLEASIEHITQPSLSVSPDGTEAFACWTNLRQSTTVGMLIEEFGDMIYKTRGAYDTFEYTSIKGEGWLMGDQYVTGYKVHVAGTAEIVTTHAQTGARSMCVTDTSATLPAYALRQIPSMRAGTVGISLYIPSTNTTDYVFELKHAYNYTCGEFTVAGFGVKPDGTLFLVDGAEQVTVGSVSTDCWNDYAIQFDMVDTKTGTLLVNGSAVTTFDLNIQSDRITVVELCESAASSTTGSVVYADNFYAVEPTLVTVETSLCVSDYTDSGTLPEQDGSVFAGWYTDAARTQPHTESTGFAYPKFVDEDILSAKVQVTSGTTADQAATDLRLVTTVDSLYYSQVGFNITIGGSTVEASTTTVYKRISASDGSSAFEYSPNIFSSESQYFMTYTITGIPNAFFGQTITVVPYWITLDGTRVEGKELSFTINEVIGVSPGGLTSATQGSGDSDSFANMFGGES